LLDHHLLSAIRFSTSLLIDPPGPWTERVRQVADGWRAAMRSHRSQSSTWFTPLVEAAELGEHRRAASSP
jgi:hypothetical protein